MNDITLNENRKQLLVQLKAAEGIQTILDIAYELLGNPINMFDLSYNLLAHTENTVSDDPIWNEFIALGKFSHETVNFFNNEKFIAAYAASPVALMKSPKLKYDRANATIFGNDGLQIGNITVVACYRPFEEEDFRLMELVCQCLAKELEKTDYSGKISHIFEDSAFLKLIDCASIEDTLPENELRKLNQSFKSYIYVAVIDTIQYENTLSHLIYFKELFRKFNKEFQYFIYLNNIVIIFSSDKPVVNAEKELEQFNTFFSQNSIFAGVSSAFHSLSDLKTYFKQALNALNYGICLNSGKNIFSYDTFSIELFLNSHIEEVNISKLCHPILFSVLEYDEKNNSQYTEILYSYFICGLDQGLAAKRINMTPDTYNSYLKSAAEIFQIDWNDGNLLFSLFRSIKLSKCFPEKFQNNH